MKVYPLFAKRFRCHQLGAFLQEHSKISKLKLVENIDEADYILAGGGDGFMLNSMREYYQFNKPFLGVNCGTLGFLLNEFNSDSLGSLTLDELDQIEVDFVEVVITYANGNILAGHFINDCVIGGNVLDYYTFTVTTEEYSFEAKGTGLLVSTPIGSTAYAMNLGQPMIPLQSRMRGIVGIATAPYKREFLCPQKITITATGKSSVMLGLDGYNGKHNEISKVEIFPSKKRASLCFLKDQNFYEKRLKLATQKLGR